jgi:hypothetical protein
MPVREIGDAVAVMQYPLRAFGIDFRRCVTQRCGWLTGDLSFIRPRRLRRKMSRRSAASDNRRD